MQVLVLVLERSFLWKSPVIVRPRRLAMLSQNPDDTGLLWTGNKYRIWPKMMLL
jgi:hypothetical protein